MPDFSQNMVFLRRDALPLAITSTNLTRLEKTLSQSLEIIMSILKTTLVTTALIFGSTTTVFAQSAILDQAKDVVVDKGVDIAKDKATSSLPSVGGSSLPGVGSLGGSLPSVGGSSLPSVGGLGGITDTSLSSGESITAGKVLLKGGSKEDAAIAVAKDRGKNKLKDFGSSTVYGTAPTTTELGSDTVYGTAPTTTTAPAPSAPAAAAINCPYGTTAQPNGTCMITGDYK